MDECEEFAAKLRREARPEWSRNYVNFELLCGKCTELVELQSASADGPVFQAKRHIFQGLLDAQIEEVPAPCVFATAYSFRRAGINEHGRASQQAACAFVSLQPVLRR